MKRSDAYKLAIEAVILSGMNHDNQFYVLQLLYQEYGNELYLEELNARDAEE